MTTADDILTAIRHKYPKSAIVSEVVLDDQIELALYRRQAIERAGARWAQRTEDYYTGKGHVIAEEVPDGWDSRTTQFYRRIDGLMLAGGEYTAIEIKCTRADFKRETEEKRRAWRNVTHRFIYAAPAGIIDPADLPPYAGLWEFGEDKYGQMAVTSVKRATKNKTPEPMPQQVITAMFYRAAKAEAGRVRRARRPRRR